MPVFILKRISYILSDAFPPVLVFMTVRVTACVVPMTKSAGGAGLVCCTVKFLAASAKPEQRLSRKMVKTAKRFIWQLLILP